MKYKIYCVTCNHKLVATCNVEIGDKIDATVAPGLKNHIGHECEYHPMGHEWSN